MRKGWNFLLVSTVVFSLCAIPVEGASEELVGNAENGKKVITEEIECIGCHTIDHKGTGKKPVDKSGSGEQLVKQYDCRACHKIWGYFARGA